MMGSLAGGMDDSMLAIVVPAADIQEAASQAPEDAAAASPEPEAKQEVIVPSENANQ